MQDRPKTSRGYWEKIASGGTWAGYYDGPPNSRTYNFFTRRACVTAMSSGEGSYRRILDVGCGTADYAPLASHHDAQYVGVDYSISMIDQARDRTEDEAGTHLFSVGAGDRLSFRDDSFDLVVAVGYIEYFHDASETLEELRRVMTDGSVLVMQSFKRDLLGRMRQAYERALGRARGEDERLPDDWVDRKYSGPELDRLLARFGFERIDRTYNNFYLLPEVVRRKMPRLYFAVSEAAGRFAPRLLRFAAVNYVGKYKLTKTDT